jgi:hypothetical protein
MLLSTDCASLSVALFALIPCLSWICLGPCWHLVGLLSTTGTLLFFLLAFLDADLHIRLTFALAYTLLGIVFVIFGLASNSLFALVSLSLLLGLPVNFLTVSKLLLLASSGFHAFATLAALFGLSVSFLVLAFLFDASHFGIAALPRFLSRLEGGLVACMVRAQI